MGPTVARKYTYRMCNVTFSSLFYKTRNVSSHVEGRTGLVRWNILSVVRFCELTPNTSSSFHISFHISICTKRVNLFELRSEGQFYFFKQRSYWHFSRNLSKCREIQTQLKYFKNWPAEGYRTKESYHKIAFLLIALFSN